MQGSFSVFAPDARLPVACGTLALRRWRLDIRQHLDQACCDTWSTAHVNLIHLLGSLAAPLGANKKADSGLHKVQASARHTSLLA